MRPLLKIGRLLAGLLSLGLIGLSTARADAVTDWNIKSGELVVEARVPTPVAVAWLALVQTAAYRAVEAARRRDASAEAALAAAHRVTLTRLLPASAVKIDALYDAALAAIAESTAKRKGIVDGQAAADGLLMARAADITAAAAPEQYRPHTTAGLYVPTAAPLVSQWPQRKPWLMRDATQLRPAAPPALTSVAWQRDFNEVKSFGGRASAARSAEQTEVARFWEYSAPPIYHALVRSVALQPGRDLLRNARLFAAVAQATDDALIAVFEAKYHYRFWRPVTAIRNADLDGNDATERDAGWLPLIDAPMHPEYPSAHSVLAAALGTVLAADVGDAGLPVLSTSSPTAQGAVRRYDSIAALVKEVNDARVWGGIHFRTATDVGAEMGRQAGELAVKGWLQAKP